MDFGLSAGILAQGQSGNILRRLGRERSGQGFFFPILNHLPIFAMRLIQRVYAGLAPTDVVAMGFVRGVCKPRVVSYRSEWKSLVLS